MVWLDGFQSRYALPHGAGTCLERGRMVRVRVWGADVWYGYVFIGCGRMVRVRVWGADVWYGYVFIGCGCMVWVRVWVRMCGTGAGTRLGHEGTRLS